MLYIPGPDETLSYFEAHLRDDLHREQVMRMRRIERIVPPMLAVRTGPPPINYISNQASETGRVQASFSPS